MKSRTSILVSAITLLALLAIVAEISAQENAAQTRAAKHHHYQFIDLGTFGGPSSFVESDNGENGAVNKVVNSSGTVAGWGDTATYDPYAPNCFNPYYPDCYLPHAFRWSKGVLTDLGILPGGDASTAAWISDSGLIAGQGRNGLVDPLIPGFPETRAVLWKDGEAIDLGTLGGNESSAFSVNNRGQVVGVAVNTIPDPFSFWVTQLRAFLWQGGAMQDLGTLGGPEAWALFINGRDQVAGLSLTNATPNSTTGYPTQDPFLWERGTMLDLGTLGGTIGSAFGLNERGQVIGTSNLAGDLTFHPFLWDKRSNPHLRDLGTLGGDNGQANAINDAGEVVGKADLPGSQTHDAFLWIEGQGMLDLGTQDGDACSNALAINSQGQVVGGSTDCSTFQHAFLWEGGGPMIDLNALVPLGADLTLTEAANINDNGEIIAQAVLTNGDTHAVVLIPCDDGHTNVEGCDYSMVDTTEAENSVTTARTELTGHQTTNSLERTINPLRNRLMQRYRMPGERPATRD